MKRLLTKAEMAEFLGCSQCTVDQLRSTGKLRAVMVGDLVRFDETSIREYLELAREERGCRTRRQAAQLDLVAAIARGEAAMGKGRPVRSTLKV